MDANIKPSSPAALCPRNFRFMVLLGVLIICCWIQAIFSLHWCCISSSTTARRFQFQHVLLNWAVRHYNGQYFCFISLCTVRSNGRAIKKDLLIPTIGPPPGFPKIPIKLAKCIMGAEVNDCFIKTDWYMEGIGAPPSFTEINVKRHLVLLIKCCECLQGVKNGTCAVDSDVKAVKVNIKRETFLKDINFVKPNFGQSPPSKGTTLTMIKCQNASIICAKNCCGFHGFKYSRILKASADECMEKICYMREFEHVLLRGLQPDVGVATAYTK